MSTVPLPERPDLGQLRNQARELQTAVRAGDPQALEPRRHIEVITERSWVLPEPATTSSLADEFLRLACLNFTNDDPAHRTEAARLLAAHPHLPGTDLAVAAACADAEQVGRLLADDPAAARGTGGPFGWSPLMYQAYARHDPDLGRDATARTAQLLLDAGADPDDGRFFSGLPTPFTLLTGVFGGGERDQPPHPQHLPLARVLLAAGADPNDGQALYNRMFETNDDHLKLLFEYGLGQGDGGPWHRLLGDQLQTPQTMLRRLLGWAVSHDQRERVALLAAHGVDVVSPLPDTWRSPGAGREAREPLTPIEIALLDGNRELAQQLRRLGAGEPRLDPVEAFVAAALAGDAETVAATPAEVIARARAARPGLIVWAAGQGKLAAIDLLITNGFDLDALGRSDTPIEQPWQTGLHAAVANGDLVVVQHLLDLGADPTRHDQRFDSTPFDWARHFEHADLIALLQPSVD